jgi:hypothetical protein
MKVEHGGLMGLDIVIHVSKNEVDGMLSGKPIIGILTPESQPNFPKTEIFSLGYNRNLDPLTEVTIPQNQPPDAIQKIRKQIAETSSLEIPPDTLFWAIVISYRARQRLLNHNPGDTLKDAYSSTDELIIAIDELEGEMPAKRS